MSEFTDWLDEEEKKRLSGQRPQRTPPRSPQNLVESSPYARVREIDHNKQVESESSGSLGPIDLIASGVYHFANSALMGLPDYGIAAAKDGWTPYDLEETNGWGKVGGIIGEAAGFLIPIGYAGKLAALPFKVLSKSSGKIMGRAAATAGKEPIKESIARAVTRTTGTVRAKNFIPGVTDARRTVTREVASKELNIAAEKSIRKTMNKAVDEGSSRRGLFRKLFPDKPKKWLPRTFSHTSKQSIQLQKQIERNVRAGLKKDFQDIPGMTDDMINTIANNFVKGLGKGEHLNTAGAWITHGLGAGTPGWLRARVAGYSGRFADMMLSFGIYNTIDEILHRQLEDGYVPRSTGEITKSTAMFAAVLPLIEAIPGGISGAMTIKNYKDIAGIMKKPKYGEMSKYELTTFYDYIKYKMPGRKVGKVSDSKMRIRNTDGVSDGVSRSELAAGLDEWYLGARKDFRKMFVGEEAKNFAYALPRMVAGGMYFSGAINEGALMRGDLHEGFFGDEFMHHLKEDPASVATHMLTGVFFTRNRKPLSRDVKGRFPHQVHYSEEYQGKLAMLREMGFDSEILEFYFNSFSQTDIRKSILGRSYQETVSGREITEIMNKAMANAKAKAETGKYVSELDAVEDKNLIEGYDIWSASKASEIISTQDRKSREIDGRDMLESLSKSERQELNRQIDNIVIRQRADGTFERISDSNWNTIRSEIFDKTILNNHYQFFFDYLKTIGEMGPNAAEIIIENEGTHEARILNLPRIQRGQVTDVGELNKYEYVANKLVKEGKAKWAEGTETEIKAEDFNKEGKWDKLAEETHRFEENYARSILGEDVNIRIDFNNLDVVWDHTLRLKERSLMENLVRIVNGDRIEELPEKHQQVYNIIKDIFGASFSRDWRAYTGADSENGDEILMKGEGKKKEEWDKRSVDEKAETEQIMKVIQLVHNLAQYTPLGNSSNMTPKDANDAKPISLAQGQALLKSLRQAGYVGGILSSGEVSSSLRRYLYERAVDTQKISKMDFALLQHTLDEGVALEPRLVGKDVSIVIPTPDAVNDLLFKQHPEDKKRIRQVVRDYRNLIYNRLMGFQGLVTDTGLGTYFSGEGPSIRDIAEGKNVKRMLDLTDFEQYVRDAVMLTSVKSNESKNELRSVIDRLKETEIWSSIDGFLKSMIDSEKINNLEHMKEMTKNLRDNLDSRRGGLTEEELGILNRVHEKAAAHIKVLEELEGIDKADFGQTDVNTLIDSQTKLGNAMDALKNILNTNGSWDSRKEMNKLIGDVIQGLGGDTTLKAGIAYARLKRGLLDNIARGKRGETLEEVEERYEKEGRFSDFQKIVVKTLTGAFDSLDKDQLEALNRQVEKEAKSYLAGIREIQFTISPNTIARKYGDIFVDDKTKAFSEELKQEILSAYKADIASEAGGVENIREVIDKMIKSVKENEDASVADFVIEELPKLLHTLVSTVKKEELRYDDSKKDLKEQEIHGSIGPLDNFMTWWTDTIKDVHEKTNTPNIYFSRLSRSAIIDGFLKDIDSKEGFDYEALIRSLDGLSSELTPEALNEANKRFGEDSNIEAISEAARKRGRAFRFEVFTVDFGGHDILIDMNGLQESAGGFKEQAKKWYNEKLKWLGEEQYVNEEGVTVKGKGNKAAATQFEKAFQVIIKRFDGEDNISFEDARDILRHMYYDFSNKSGHDALFEHGGDVKLMMEANANLFKYAIVAQGENAGRLSSKLGEILLDVSKSISLDKSIEIPEGRIQGQMDFIQSLDALRNNDWNFNVSVIADQKVGGIESIFGSRNLVNTVYKDMIEKSFNRILRKKGLDKSILAEAGIDVGEIFDASLKLDKTVTPTELIEKLFVEIKEPIGIVPVGKADIAKEKRRLAKKKKRADLLKAIKSDVLMNEIANVLSWRKQSLEELTKIDDGTSAMDGVTYLSTSTAKVIFGMNGFHIGDGFASVKPVISHNTNSFFDGGNTNETLIGKTNFVYDPRVAQYLDKKGIDIMMGKSAAKSFSGRVSEMPLQEGLPIGNIFQYAVDAVDMKNNFKLPIGSIGVIYSARALHPAKIVPVAAIGMSANDSRDYSKYMGLENQIKQLANDAVGLNDYRRTGIINSLVNQAKETGYDLDVGGGGLAMELFKIGMDASDPFIKREVKRVFHKARGALIGAVEKPGAGVSVLIPEFDVSLPSYGEVGGNRRQLKYGGKKIPHEMGTRAGLYATVNDLNLLYIGEDGQDILFRDGDHIDPTKQNFILSAEEGKKGRASSVKEFSKRLNDLIQNTRKEDGTGDLDFRDMRVVDLYQLFSLRFRKDKDGNPMIEELRSNLENAHLHIGSTEEGLTNNVIRILRANFGRGDKFKTSKELYDFTELASELGIGMAVPGLRIPSQSYADVVISRLEGVYAKSFGNVIGANIFDVFTKHQGDFDVDKMFFYLDAPVSLMHKGIRNAGYNVEPQTPPSQNLQAGSVDLLNNDFKPGGEISSNNKRDGAAQRRKDLVQNKYLIGRTNRLNYSLAMLRETGFTIAGEKYKDKYADFNNFEKITPESEAAMGYMSQRASNLASLILDPHKNPHKAAFMKDHEILRWLLFGEWNDANGPSPDKDLPVILTNVARSISKDEAIKNMFPWLDQPNIERGWGTRKETIILAGSHKEVLKDLYIESINVMGRAGRVFSGIFDETGQRAPEHWEYSDLKDTINRFRKEPTKFLFNRLAWKYRKDDKMKTALFDLMVRYNKGHYGDQKTLATDVEKGNFNYNALDPGFITHNFTQAANEKRFYELTPALSVLNGIVPGDDNKTIYDYADEAVSREMYSNYSGAARDLIDSYIFLRAFSPDVQDITRLWDKAQNRIRAESGPSEIRTQQQRDILWQVLEKELRSQDGYLKYLKRNKNTSSYDIEVTANRMHRIQSILDHVKNQSLHSDAAKKNLLLEEDYEGGWAKIQIQNGGKRGGWYENRNKQDVVVYEVDIADNITNLANVEYKMLKGGQRLKGTYGGRDPQKLWVGRNQKIVVLKNPIRNISTDKSEFLHGLAAFAASTTLTPESLRVPFEDKDRNLVDQFYNDIDIVKTALKDYGSQLKENIKRNPNDKKMTFAVDGWKVNDLMRVLMSRYVDVLPGEIREDRLTDIFELLTMVEPLHGAEARIPGLKDVSIPVFIQNRAVFKGVTGFYLRQLGDEGRVVVQDYVKRKSAFYRAFTDRSGDLDEIDKGFRERLFSQDTRILPRHLKELGEHHRVVNDILYRPLTTFSDFSLRMALNTEFGIRPEQLKRRPIISRQLVRPWGSTDALVELQTYANSVGTDPNNMFSTARTFGKQARDALECLAKTF